MKDLGRIQGSAASAVPLWECEDCVYVNTNIEKIETEEGEVYEFDCVQYTHEEYNKLRLSNIELAIAEIIEGGLS